MTGARQQGTAEERSGPRPSKARGGKPEAVRVYMLGGFGVSVGPRSIREQWRLKKAASLVKLLALAEGHRLHREQAMELLWPDLDPESALNNLHYALHVARRILVPAAPAGIASRYLHLGDGRIALCPDGPLWVDAEAFEEAAATARHAGEPQAFRAAIDLYAGELLPQDRYEPWAEERRAQLRGLYLSLLTELADLHEGRAEYEAAVELLRRVVAEERTEESAHVALMRLHALSGKRREALAQYERLREALIRDFGAEPGATAARLQREIWAGTFPNPSDLLSADLSAVEAPTVGGHAGGARRPDNLPLARTSFVGRGREWLEVKRFLAMTSLLTLTGAGGCGKTRLALEVARDLVGAYPDGVWLVELASLSEGALVPKAVAEALGVPERSAEPLMETLAEVLQDGHLLLILDNCEHLLEAAARLVDRLLDSCPRLRILATSREALGVEGEMRWPVPPLSMPDPRGTPSSGVSGSSETLQAYESVRLFVERARERDPAFSLTSKNAPAVGEICAVLEGLPLAIELAAARVSILSVGQISERLADSLKLLKGTRTQTPRQQTLRGTLDWSYALLSEDEKKLFGRLSAFAGGWTLEAAEAVGGSAGHDDTLDVLSGLVEKSLVVAEAIGEGDAGRYRLLEPIRQYARAELEEGGEREAVLRRHAHFFLALAEEARPKLRGPEVAEWSRRLETEHDNMRTALSFALQTGQIELAFRLAGELGTFWYMHSHSTEGRKWLEVALAGDEGAPAALRIRALEALYWLAFDQWDHDRAEAVAREANELGTETEIENSLAAALRIMSAGPLWVRGDYDRGKELLEEGLRIGREAGDSVIVAEALMQLAGTAWVQGDIERGNVIYQEGIDLCREVGYTYRLPDFLLSLGYQLLLEGDYQQGAALNEEAAAVSRELGYSRGLNLALDNQGWSALLGGDHEAARPFYEESLVVCKALGDKACASESLDGLACVAAARGEAARAGRLFGAAEAMREALSEAVAFGHTPEEAAWREPHRAKARSRVGEAAWEASLEEGRAMGLKEAIEYALSEEEPAPPTPVAVPESPTPLGQRTQDLTAREREVALLVGRGLTNRRIAEELSISEHTVANHVRKILRKLKVRSRAQIPSLEP